MHRDYLLINKKSSSLSFPEKVLLLQHQTHNPHIGFDPSGPVRKSTVCGQHYWIAYDAVCRNAGERDVYDFQQFPQ